MAHVLSKSAMRRVAPAELEELAGQYREALVTATQAQGRETNV